MNEYDIALPKWPCCVIKGKQITKEQAAEIIIRTDNFKFSGNDREYKKQFENLNIKEKDYNVLNLYYLNNYRIISSYIGGHHGWVDWEGNIKYYQNIGKWPTVSDVYNEWVIIANEFPYLELECQLMDGEEGETDINPLINFKIKNGHVETYYSSVLLEDNTPNNESKVVDFFSGNTKEYSLSIEELSQKFKFVKNKVKNDTN